MPDDVEEECTCWGQQHTTKRLLSPVLVESSLMDGTAHTLFCLKRRQVAADVCYDDYSKEVTYSHQEVILLVCCGSACGDPTALECQALGFGTAQALHAPVSFACMPHSGSWMHAFLV